MWWAVVAVLGSVVAIGTTGLYFIEMGRYFLGMSLFMFAITLLFWSGANEYGPSTFIRWLHAKFINKKANLIVIIGLCLMGVGLVVQIPIMVKIGGVIAFATLLYTSYLKIYNRN